MKKLLIRALRPINYHGYHEAAWRRWKTKQLNWTSSSQQTVLHSPVQGAVSACGRPRVDVEFPLMLVSMELVGVTGDEDVDVQLPLHHGQTLHLAPGHHLVAVTQPDAELAHCHHLLLRVVHVLLTAHI